MMETYKKYKPFAGKWLLQIPDSWAYVPTLRYMSSLVDYRGKTPEKVKDGVFLVTAKNIKNGRIDYEISKEFIDEEAYDEVMRRGKPEINDILFTTEAPLGEIALVDKIDIALAQRVIKFRPISELFDSIYLKYYFQSVFFQQTLRSLATGSTAIGIKSSKLCLLRSLKPSISEQTQIAKFLDYKTSQIDKLIEQKEKLLTLLTEKRTAIITQAVTKGLDPSVEMKDSGIDWLGEIPKHWEVKKMKFTSQITNSNVDKKTVEGQETVILCNYVDVYKNDYIVEGLSFMESTASNDDIKKFSLHAGDVIITKDSESANDIGIPAFVKENIDGLVCGYHLSLIRVDNMSLMGEFLFYFLKSTLSSSYFEIYAQGVTRFGLSLNSIKSIFIPIPPDEQQKQICDYLENYLQNTNKTLLLFKESIQKLKEYREALITSAVTGQIDVRKEKIDE